MPRLLPSLLALASALGGAEAVHVAAAQSPAIASLPEVPGYTMHQGLILTRYAVSDTALYSRDAAATRCTELGDLCHGITCNADASSCSVRAATMLQSSTMGEVTYQKSMDTMIMAAVNAIASKGISQLEAAASDAVREWAVLAPTPAPVKPATAKSQSLGGSLFGGIQQMAPAPAPQINPYMDQSASVLQALKDVRTQELATTMEMVQATKDGEASKVAQMNSAIQKARQASLPEVVLAAEEYTRSEVHNQAVSIEQTYLARALAAEEKAEAIRKSVTVSTEDALEVAKSMVELAKEAENVALHLNNAHAYNFTSDVVAEDTAWKDIALQSQRISMIAENVIREADAVANRALSQAKRAEKNADIALKTAQSNTKRLSKLKLKAQDVLNKANHPR